MEELVVQFAILWGQFIGSAISPHEIMVAEEMKNYSSDELVPIFNDWAKEYLENDFVNEDTVEYFGEKLSVLIQE